MDIMDDSDDHSSEQTLHDHRDTSDLKLDDRYDAPVLWVSKTYGVSKEHISERTIKAIEESGLKGVEIVEIYITNQKSKSHMYMLLNSERASELLLNSTVSVIVDTEEGENQILWWEKADHLIPRGDQNPNMLYIWNLPKTRPSGQVADELRRFISRICPIIDIYVPQDNEGNGLCIGWAKVELEYEFDTQKCIYLMNFNFFLSTEIRASFCNGDKKYQKPKDQSNFKRSKNQNKVNASNHKKGHKNESKNPDTKKSASKSWKRIRPPKT